MFNKKSSYSKFISIRIGGYKNILVFIILLISGFASAQQPPPVFILSDLTWKESDDFRSFEYVENKYSWEIDRELWGEIFAALAKNFDKSSVWADTSEIHRKFRAELNNLVVSYVSAASRARENKESVIYSLMENYSTGRFFGLSNPSSNGFIVYFNGHKNEITLSPAVMNEEQAMDLRYRAETIDKLLTKAKKKPREDTRVAIQNSLSAWKSFIDDGFSQYPWESFINGHYYPGTIQSPPGKQLTILHPGIGVEVSRDGFKQLRAKEVLNLDVIGILFYRNDWKSYAGISGVVTLREDMGTGVGFLIRTGKYINLGLTWHDSNGDGKILNDDPFFVTSVTFFKSAKSVASQYQKQIDDLKIKKRRHSRNVKSNDSDE